MRYQTLVATLSLFLCTFTAHAEFVVHEWGTFTSLVGSNGVTQNGMYHEDEALPDFVHDFGDVRSTIITPVDPIDEDRCGKMPCRFIRGQEITQKMETPVIYFYSDITRDVTVDVAFPNGTVSETFPAPVTTFPNRNSRPPLINGRTSFEVEVLNPGASEIMKGSIPRVEAGNIYGHARDVRSNLIRSGNDYERFIFYRGLGQFQPEMQITSKDGALRLYQPAGKIDVPYVALVHVDQSGHGRLLTIGRVPSMYEINVSAQEIAELSNHTLRPAGAIRSGAEARSELIGSLFNAGLKLDEAAAMVKTWENGYLKVPGLRLLYILPDREIERTLPLTVTPKPDSLERVFVGRIEVMTDMHELELLKLTQNARDLFDVASLGRFAEPMLRRVEQVYREMGGTQAGTLEMYQRLIARAAQLTNQAN